MSFRSLWVFLGLPLIIVGLAAEIPMITGIGLIITVIIALSRVWSRRLFDRFNLNISLSSTHVYQEEKLYIDVEIENRKFLPLPWLRIAIQLSNEIIVEGKKLKTVAGEMSQTVTLSGSIGWYEKKNWRVPISSKYRGNFPIGPTSIYSSDLFGLFGQKQQFNGVTRLIVYPKIISVENLSFPSDRPLGDLKGRNQLFEDPLRITGLRNYEPGDPLRRIDWKATAKTGEMQSKVYAPSASQHLYIFMNIDTLNHSWEGFLPEELETTISVAASIAVWANTQRYAVGLLANGSLLGSDSSLRLPPSRSKSQLPKILESLAAIQPLTMGTLASSVNREVQRLPIGSTVVLVAAFIPEDLSSQLKYLRNLGYQVNVVLTAKQLNEMDLFPLPVQVVGDRYQEEAIK
jgi:uncharacterized protein (DUF58 family)